MCFRAMLVISMTLLTGWALAASPGYEPESGDIIFHTSKSGQSNAIQLVTGSKYSHVGIVYLSKGGAMVFEAVQPVKSTPLKEWIARGVDGHFAVKRLRAAKKLLTDEGLRRMEEEGNRLLA